MLISTAFICEADLSSIEDEMQILRMFYQEKELVISATRHPKPISQVAENITVITAKEIERMNAHTISEVLNRVPGMFLRNFNHDFGSPAMMSIHGSDEANVRVLLDGITWNQLANNSPETISIPVGIVERIEIIKGPASSAWGSSLGGVVNIITKSAGDTKIPAGMVQASFGERDTRDYRAEISGLAGPVGCYLFGARQKSDGLRDSRAFDNNSFFSKFSIPVSDSINAIISMGYTEPETDFGTNLSGKANTRTFHSKALIEARLNDNLDFSIAAYHFKQESVFSFHDPAFDMKNRYDDQTTGGSATIAWSNQYHTAVLGFDFDHGELDQTEKRISKSYRTDPEIKKWALYANDTIIIKKLSITPGLRYDHNSLTGSFLSPSIGATYQIGKESILRGSVARGFTIPPVSYVSGGSLAYEPNKSLDSEEIWSYQGGFETAAAEFLWIKATYFFHNLHKELNLDQTKGLFINQGKTRRQGIEVEAQTIPFYNFTCFAGFSYVHIDSSEESRSQNMYTYNLSIKYDDKKTFYMELFGGYTWWNTTDDYGAKQKYDSFIWDLNINKKLDFKTKLCPEIFLTAHNIFNGSQYVWEDIQNPRRWVEAGLRIRF